jgi:hypothetical protein
MCKGGVQSYSAPFLRRFWFWCGRTLMWIVMFVDLAGDGTWIWIFLEGA